MYTARKLSGALALLLLLSAMAGCSPASSGTPSATPDTDPGTLVRIEYSYSSGMVAHTAFSIDVEPSRIVTARYWPYEDWEADEMTELADVAIAPEQWQELDAVVQELADSLKPVVPLAELADSVLPDMLMVQDGGDTFAFALTWEKDGEQTRVQYSHPSDRRFSTLAALLEELAEPIGRDIPRYEAPRVSGIYFCSKPRLFGEKYSYQCTPVDNADLNGEFYLFAYWDEGLTERSYNGRVDAQAWEDIATVCQGLNVEALPERSRRKQTGTSLTLYYSDGTQTTYQPDKDTLKALRTYFAALVASQQK